MRMQVFEAAPVLPVLDSQGLVETHGCDLGAIWTEFDHVDGLLVAVQFAYQVVRDCVRHIRIFCSHVQPPQNDFEVIATRNKSFGVSIC